jgi:glycosyltransferase involved in cell wall biosynthesis
MSDRTMAVVLLDYPVPARTGYHLRMLSTLAVAQALGWRTSVLWFGAPTDRYHGESIPHANEMRRVGTRSGPRALPARVVQRGKWLAGTVAGRGLTSYPFSLPYEGGRDAVTRAVGDAADAVLLPTTLCHWAPDLRRAGALVIGDAADIVADLAMKLLRSESHANPVRAAGLAVNYLACRAQERRYLRELDEVWVTSFGEIDRALHLGARRVVVVPSTCERWQRAPSDRPDSAVVGFIGNFRMPSNLAAARFLVEDVLPQVQRAVPDVVLRLAGDGLPDDIYPRPGLEILGPVDDATKFVESCAVCALPLHVRGGVPLKLFEAMALGRPVVASPELIAGLPITPGDDVLVARGADAFAKALVRLVTDPELARRLAARARATFESEFSLNAAIGRARDESIVG